MNSIKCPQCGLVYWASAPACKRCGLATPGHETSNEMTQTPQPADNVVPSLPVSASYWVDDPEKEDLLKNLKRDSQLFYFIGGLQFLVWFLVGQLLIFDAILNVGLSFVAYKFKSRVAAIMLLCLTLLSVFGAIFAMMAMGAKIGLIAPVALIFRMIASIRIVYTTYKLNLLMKPEMPALPVPPPPPVFQQDPSPQWQ